MRTFKLLRTCQGLDQTQVSFNSRGDVIFGVYRQQERRRETLNPFGTSFRTFDSFDYSPISTIDVTRKILGLAIDPDDCYIAVVESANDASSYSPESACRLYEIGRRRPNESDRFAL